MIDLSIVTIQLDICTYLRFAKGNIYLSQEKYCTDTLSFL